MFILILKVTGSNYFFKCSLYRQLSRVKTAFLISLRDNKDVNIIMYVEYVLNLRNELGYKCKVMTFFPN